MKSQLNVKLLSLAACLSILIGCTVSPDEKPSASKEISSNYNVQETTIANVHAAFRAGTLTCARLVGIYLERIKQYDRPSGLNAIVMINPNAGKRAAMLDKEFEETGQLRELHCVPVILKDNFDTADMPTAGGSMVLKNSLPPDDAFMVRKLREAGAVIIAKSNMAEWAFSPYFTISSTLGETRNAYDLERVPAGSSGGTASAVAANFGLVGMGTDTGNSIRGPASHLALVGIRSTIGATSRDGVIPLLFNRDIAGPMSRTVEDAARIFNVIDGYDPADPETHQSNGKLPDDYLVYLKKDGLQGARIGVLRDISDAPDADQEIIALFERALNDMRALGAEIIDPFGIENLEQLTKATGFCSRFRYDINNYFTSLGPSAPVKKLEDIVDARQFHESSKGGMEWAMSQNVPPEQQEIPCVDVEGDPRRKALRDAVVKAMDEHNIDAIVYPTWNNPPRLIGDLDSPHGNNSPIIAPHSGQPAITVPMGFTGQGLPAGLQFLARPFSEANLFTFAYAYEQATHHRKPPPRFP
ncbi:MAG: amidase [Gammaproteobacteria bacterium]|nr:amidase [Gammaproteobacteria bacterium]